MTEMVVDRLVLDGFIKDAARYRWLREQHNSTDSFTWHVRSNTTDIPDELDAAIDAAMKAENVSKEN